MLPFTIPACSMPCCAALCANISQSYSYSRSLYLPYSGKFVSLEESLCAGVAAFSGPDAHKL